MSYLIRLDADGEGTKSFVQQRLSGVVVAAVDEEVSGPIWKFGDAVYFQVFADIREFCFDFHRRVLSDGSVEVPCHQSSSGTDFVRDYWF